MAEIVSKALELTTGQVVDLAQEAGFSRESLYAWAAGRRTPNPENVKRLAEVLRRRGGELTILADQLEGETED